MPLNGTRRTRMSRGYKKYAAGVMKYSGADAIGKAARKAGKKYRAYAKKSIATDRLGRRQKRAEDIKKYTPNSY